MKKFTSVLMVLALAACGGGDAPAADEAEQAAPEPAAEAPAATLDMDLPEGGTAAMVAEGEEVFMGAGICFSCHLEGGVGGPLAPNLTDDEWINIDGSYESIVQNVITGVAEPQEYPGIMLPRGGTAITDDQVNAVSAYDWTLSNGS